MEKLAGTLQSAAQAMGLTGTESLVGVFGFLVVLLMVLALVMMHRRAQAAEKRMDEMSRAVAEHIESVSERSDQSSEIITRGMNDAMKTVSDTVERMVGEITRTQQGQMDALGGQLRAAGRQDEERLERMRETMDLRMSNYEEKLTGVTREIGDKLAGSEERIEDMRKTLEGGLERMSEDNRYQLEQMRLTVDEKLNATVDRRLEASFDNVTRRLEQVVASLNAMQTLAGSVDELSRTLGAGQPLGVWGEVQLGSLLSQMLAPEQYAQHAAVKPGGEPVADYVVVMPGQGHGHTVYLPVDASLPMREYAELRTALETGSRDEIERARGLLESAVRMHARRMSEKLIVPPYTTDYAVMFLQSEGLFAEVLRIGGLAERIQRESRMVIAGPTTFAALLTSLQMGFRSLAIEQRTQEIMQLLGAVRTDFTGFAGMLSKTQKQLAQASETIENAQRRSETIARRLSDVGELPGGEARRILGTADEDEDETDNWD